MYMFVCVCVCVCAPDDFLFDPLLNPIDSADDIDSIDQSFHRRVSRKFLNFRDFCIARARLLRSFKRAF